MSVPEASTPSPVSPQPPAAATAAAAAAAAAAAVADPAAMEFPLPIDSQMQLRIIQSNINELAARLGHMQVDYLQNSGRLAMEVSKLRAEYEQLLNRVAQSAGLDIDKTRWNFDANTMKLVRQSKPE